MKAPIIFGKYLLLERISVGGMAEVFLAKSFGVEGFERLLAIKRILPSMAEDDEFITMFIDEARISSVLNHANVVHIHELGRTDDSYYIAMEYVPGLDLKAIAEVYRRERQPMPVPQAVFIASKVCEGLDYAHRKKDQRGQPLNIVHRDVSPQNVLVSFEGEVKIIDFGIAKAANRQQQTQVGILKGKFGYMSPEQALGQPIDRRSDLFAVGTLLYELLTGDRLFVGESDYSVVEKVRNADVVPPRELNPEIPKGLEKIILRALAREADARYQWCSELQEDLLRYLVTDGAVYSSKQLAAFMKEVFADDLAREAARMERFASASRPAQLADPPSAPKRRTVSKQVPVVAPTRRQTGEVSPPRRSVTPSGAARPQVTAKPPVEEDAHERTQIVDASMFHDEAVQQAVAAAANAPRITAAPAESMTAQNRPEPSVVVEDTGVYEEAAREEAAEHGELAQREDTSGGSTDDTGPQDVIAAAEERLEPTPVDADEEESTPSLPIDRGPTRGSPADAVGRAGHDAETRATRPLAVAVQTVVTATGEPDTDEGGVAGHPILDGATRLDAMPEDPAAFDATRITVSPEPAQAENEDVALQTHVARPVSEAPFEADTRPRIARRRPTVGVAEQGPGLAAQLRNPKVILGASAAALALLVFVVLAALLGGGDDGALLILAEPSDARITVDGRPVTNGQVLTPIAPGEHELVVSAPGHEEVRTRITVAEGQSTLPVQLRAVRGEGQGDVVAAAGAPSSAGADAPAAPTESAEREKSAAAPSGAVPAVSTGNTAAAGGSGARATATSVASTTAAATTAAPGTATTAAATTSAKVAVRSTASVATPPPAPAAKPRPVATASAKTASRKRVMGKLACSSVPLGAEVLIDGRPVGRKTPVAIGNALELPVGRYRLTLRSNGKTFSTPIEITEGQITTVRGAVLE